MVATLTPAERALFKQCRRAWDLGARGRRNLQPSIDLQPLDVDRVMRDALAVYYFPGMWDWSRAIVIPLVEKAVEDSLSRQRARLGPELPRSFDGRADEVRRLLQAYVEWAPGVEQLAPVLVEVDYEADLVDQEQSEVGEGLGLDHTRYCGRIDLLGIDEHDAYWLVRHRVVPHWTPLDDLIRDEEAVAACWAWEQFYIGMEIAGTVHNEMRLPKGAGPESTASSPLGLVSDQVRGGVPQREGSGGGRSIPQHRRMYARANEALLPEHVTHDVGPWFRRTSIRRARSEIAQAGRQLVAESKEMSEPGVAVYPTPSEPGCGRCPFAAPCIAMYEGRSSDADAVLASSYVTRPPEELAEGRLGGMTWSSGRGAAPVRFPTR